MWWLLCRAVLLWTMQALSHDGPVHNLRLLQWLFLVLHRLQPPHPEPTLQPSLLRRDQGGNQATRVLLLLLLLPVLATAGELSPASVHVDIPHLLLSMVRSLQMQIRTKVPPPSGVEGVLWCP